MAAATENSTGLKSFTATAVALAEAVRVKLDSDGLISVAGANDDWIGVTQQAIAASGSGTVKLRSAPGTFLVTASDSFSAGDKLYATASGKVSATGGASAFTGLVAAQDSGADGDIIEAAPLVAAAGSPELVEVVAAANVITAAETGKTFFLNLAGGFASTLPAPAAGLRFRFVVATAPTTAYTVVTDSSANVIHGQIASAEDAAGSVATVASADTITFVANKAIKGDMVEVISDGTSWYVTGFCNVQDGITTTQAS